ncbi:hypothetical protein SAMN05443428_105151 [Caloramator quimbayensis]|uniref:Polymerase/histidinol phosphatase N-terminal domain-containing protein n=1 Tax=Caloramator quimbayensis TaxID=1147123 RepID=A0A1T4X3T5_9CLOT|nr:PHP domain-containing protein [Caloramator quimbayensis]SKA83715.1 hypothetical protein SAMN05443428_105151 [Caloramator quimbayensis]
MHIYIDFHIHTALSPCGDSDMTPNNIVNMAKLKGLDAIAITDHNSCENAKSCIEAGKTAGILVIPGMEIQTREDVHALCLFRNIESAMTFQDLVYNSLPQLKNRPNVFGEQILFDCRDNVIGINDRLLLTSSNISFNEACNLVKKLNGAFIPAHIDRNSFSVIYNLGFIPDNLPIKTVEYSKYEDLKRLKDSKIIKPDYRFIKSSDAHYLWDILERESFIDVDEFTVSNIIDVL